MWKKQLAFSGLFVLIVLLDPSPTPAQPEGGKGSKGFGRDGGGFGRPGGPGAFPAPGTTPGGGFGRRDGQPGGFPAPGAPAAYPMGGGAPSGGAPAWGGQQGGRNQGGPPDPERSWAFMQRLTGGTGDSIDLGKISPQTQTYLKSRTERDGGIPLPDSGVMTKAAYFDHYTRSEAAKASAGAGGGPGGSMDPNRGFGRGDSNGYGRGGMGDPNGGYGQGGYGQGGYGQGGDQGYRPVIEKKDIEEERPVVMRYGKFPKEVKDALPPWFDDLDTDKDGQVSLYEWRKGSKDTREFTEMDLNGDGLVTADEYLRFARQKNIATKIEAYDASGGTERPANWGLGAPVDGKGGDPRSKGGPGFGGPGSKGGDRGSSDTKGEKGKGNPWGKKN